MGHRCEVAASNPSVSSRRLAKRIALVLGTVAFVLAFIVLMAEGKAHATPIRPDVRQLVQPQGPPVKFEPARAGWKGSETSAAASLPMELTREAQVRAARHAVWTVLTPDPKALVAIVVLILLLRWARAQRDRQERPGTPVEDVELPQAA